MLPHEKQQLHKILRDFQDEFLPAQGEWVLAGSGVLVLHGIDRDRPMGDVDIFVATRLWFEILFKGLAYGEPWKIFTTDPGDPKRRVDPPYLYRDMHGIEVNIFQSWRKRGVGDIDVAFWILNGEMIEGIPCVPIQFLLDWKEQVGRAKDQTDIERIKAYLEKRPK